MRLRINIGEIKDRILQQNFDAIRRFFLDSKINNFEGKFFSFAWTGNVPTTQLMANTLGYVPTDWIPLARIPETATIFIDWGNTNATQIAVRWLATGTVRALIGRYREDL